MKRIALVLALPALLALAPLAHAQATTDLPDWEHLSPAQREMLIAPLRERWNTDPQARRRVWKHAERWHAMSPEQRAQARRGMSRFQDMSPAEREQARAAFEQFRQLPPEQKQALRAKLRAMTPEQRREWLRMHAGEAR